MASDNSNVLKSLAQIKIVLINTSHPGNIGSAARAMKTMGLSDLCLVSPKSFPDAQANTMASSAEDVLENTTVVDTLQIAIEDCHVVIGTSARQQRSLSREILDPRRCGELVANTLNNQSAGLNVALVFGRENSGLSNEELSYCHHLVHIPTNPDYSSLNVASAVQILAYECRISLFSQINSPSENSIDQKIVPLKNEEIVTSKDMNGYFEQLQELMIETEFLDPQEPRLLMFRLRRMYARTLISRSELNILRGMLVAFSKSKNTHKIKS